MQATRAPPQRQTPLRGLLLLPALLLATLAHVLWAGYRLGVGNQSIQIAFLRRWADPSLYTRDAMVEGTFGAYPSFFFRALAWVLPLGDIPSGYLALHLLVACGVLAAVYALARALFADGWTGPVAVLLLLAGHHRGLAGDDLYSLGFTHTWAVLPPALLALVLFYRGRYLAGFALAGVLFNLHALTAAYLLAVLGLGLVTEDLRSAPKRLLAPGAVFLLSAAPTLRAMLSRSQSFDAGWLRVMHIRSEHHSFPLSWWEHGSTDLPLFVLLVTLAALAWSFPAPPAQRRRTWALMAAMGILFAAGLLFTEVWPVPAVIRAQPFRAARLVLFVALVHIAHGLVGAVRLAVSRGEGTSAPRRALELLAAASVFLALALPTLRPWLPAATALAVVAALVDGRLGRGQAAVAGGGLCVCVAAWRELRFPLMGHLEDFALPTSAAGPEGSVLLGAALLGALLLWLLSRRPGGRWMPPLVAVAGGLACAGLLTRAFPLLRGEPSEDPWVQAQLWARDHTPRDAVFLTPLLPGGFRTFSERAVVAEWRDGTQAYFDAAFARTWWERVNLLTPGILYDGSGRKQLAAGRGLEELDDNDVITWARHFGATHVVLPTGKGERMVRVYQNAAWSIFLPELLPTPQGPAQVNAEQVQAQERFLREVVEPHIERYRKSEVRLEVVDPEGKPVPGLAFEARQVRHAFAFSAALPFFTVPEGGTSIGAGGFDYKPPPVRSVQLERFLELFNASLIPYSGKWMYVEPEEGRREYADLDQYVDWAGRHGVALEFHFLSGFMPAWLQRKTPAEQREHLLRHTRELVERYGERIHTWQVINERLLLEHAPAVFQELRRLQPSARLGLSDCARFYSSLPHEEREQDLLRGLEDVRRLRAQGVQVDYFALHGHRPYGLWADLREVYAVLDAFQREGVKVRITEFGVDFDWEIAGPVRQGRWTPELQAEYYAQVFATVFSHPAVEGINLWGIGPDTWMRGSGLLDEHYEPTPAFHRLRTLIQEQWHTQEEGQLDAQGSAGFRAFHGDYELVLTLPSAATVRLPFQVRPEGPHVLRLRLDPRTGTVNH